jgi:hypothetical protein
LRGGFKDDLFADFSIDPAMEAMTGKKTFFCILSLQLVEELKRDEWQILENFLRL